MKKVIYVSVIVLITALSCQAQFSEEKAIKETIEGFSKAGDTNDAATLADYLDPNYRIVMNQLFGSTEVSILPRAVYLDKINNKEFGGDKRILTISNVVINGKTASALVKFKGSKMTSTNIIVLVKDNRGHWLLVSDTPAIG